MIVLEVIDDDRIALEVIIDDDLIVLEVINDAEHKKKSLSNLIKILFWIERPFIVWKAAMFLNELLNCYFRYFPFLSWP